MTYLDKLKDPRWQQKRLKIMERDGWKCLACWSKEKTLTVHHLIYQGEPWEVDDRFLETLCEECHQIREDFNRAFGRSHLPTVCVLDFIAMNQMWRIGQKYTMNPLRFGYNINYVVATRTAQRMGITMEEASSMIRKKYQDAIDSKGKAIPT